MHTSVLDFGARVLTPELVTGRHVLEIGSLDVNGSLRPLVERLEPASYLGIDQVAGPGVDLELEAERVGELGSFDLVISTEMLEHATAWRTVAAAMRSVVAEEGALLVTTRGPGFPFHGWPTDEWRYTVADMSAILADFELLELEPDPEAPGVFALARKPAGWIPSVDLEAIELEPAPPNVRALVARVLPNGSIDVQTIGLEPGLVSVICREIPRILLRP